MKKLSEISKWVYACPERKFHLQLWKKLQEKFTVKEIAQKVGVNLRQLYKWKEEIACYPLAALIKLSELAELEPKLEYIKTRRAGLPLWRPKTEFVLNTELSEFFGHLLHDGGIDMDFRVHYTTDNLIMAKRFIHLVEKCFGKTKVNLRKGKNKITLYFPSILGLILTKLFGMQRGSKVENDVGIPKELLENDEKDNLIAYIVAAYICDGEKKAARITTASKNLDKPPQLLKDIKLILEKLGFSSIEIKPSTIYETQRGRHRGWKLSIVEKKEKMRFFNMVGGYTSSLTIRGRV